MKKAAHVVNEKKLNLMPLDQLKQVTGYVRGGCSPIGMKHSFKTTIDASAKKFILAEVKEECKLSFM